MSRTAQPAPTREIDLRPWQHMGQHDPTVHLIDINHDLKTYQILFYPNPECKEYRSETVQEVARFGKQKCFGIYEGKHARYCVDIAQSKYLAASFLSNITDATPLHKWKPTIDQYIEWKTKYYDHAQGIRMETIEARFPVAMILERNSFQNEHEDSSSSMCVTM